MKGKFLRVWALIRKTPIVAFFVAILCFDMLFFSDFSVINTYRYGGEIVQLRREIARYREVIENDRERLQELKSEKGNLEKFARETYQMKRENEDVFIIVDKEK